MPYITTERVKEIRNQIKKEFPKFKFSIRRQHHSSVCVSIMSAPFDLIPDNEKKYEQVNEFYIKDHYKETPETAKILSRIYEIANFGNGVFVEDSDYGTVPDFYVNISIGQWDKPFKVN